jgi:hypothetical protein
MEPDPLLKPLPYVDATALPKPRFKLWRTRFNSPRPMHRFAPPIPFHPLSDVPPPDVAANHAEYILVEDTTSVLHRDGTVTSRQRLVTLLNGAAELAAWDEFVRTYDSRREKHRILTARLLTPEGRWVAARRKVTNYNVPGGLRNSHGRHVQLQFQPLRPGVIVELEETYDNFRVDQFGPTLANQIFLRTAIPCRWRRFVFAAARPFAVHYRLHHGAAAPVERHDRDYHVCTWEVHDAEGYELDEWTPPMRDFAPWIDVTTANTWSPFAAKFRSELAPSAYVGADVAAIADDLSAGKNTPLEKAAAAYTYVARSVRYGRPPAESLTRNARSAEQMLQDLRGDCKDKSALLVQLLRSMKMDARIAVVLTGDAGRTPHLPSARFNHALVRLEHEGRVHWLDAASGPFAFGDLPAIDQGIPALVLDQSSYYFDQVRPLVDDARRSSRRCTGRLLADGSYEFDLEASVPGEMGARLRMLLSDRTEEHRLRALQSWVGSEFAGASGSDFTYGSVDDLTHSFSYRCRVRVDHVVRTLKDLRMFRIPWSSPLAMSGPFASSERATPLVVPVDYQVFDRHDIELPAGASLYAAPEAVAHECDWGSYRCSIAAADGRLVCERQLHLAGDAVPRERFAEYQQFWRQCSWADDEILVLRQNDG